MRRVNPIPDVETTRDKKVLFTSELFRCRFRRQCHGGVPGLCRFRHKRGALMSPLDGQETAGEAEQLVLSKVSGFTARAFATLLYTPVRGDLAGKFQTAAILW